MSDRELLEGFFRWLVCAGVAAEGHNPDSLATTYLMEAAARNVQASIDANEDQEPTFYCPKCGMGGADHTGAEFDCVELQNCDEKARAEGEAEISRREDEDANTVACGYCGAIKANCFCGGHAREETEDERIKRETMNEAHREAERDLEKVARTNSGLTGARR